jgi:uncharacterized glyoxalase superfamily protein PhnB
MNEQNPTNHQQLLTTRMMTPTERRMGRFMRAPDHGESGSTQDNQGGNDGTQNNESSNENNSGSGFNPEAFWNEPDAGKSNSPSGGSAESGKPASGDQQSTDPIQSAAQEIQKQFDAISFGEAFNAETIKAMEEGDMTKINQVLQTQHRQVITNTLQLAGKIIQLNNERMEARFQQMVDAKFGNRDNSDTLLKEFPAARDPAVRPMIEGVFNQAMKHANNNRVKAVEMAKDMLKYMGKTSAADLGLQLPQSADDISLTDNSRSLVDELLGRE